LLGGPDRVRVLKSKLEITQGEIIELFDDEDVISALNAYQAWKNVGVLPYADLADCPYWLVQTINVLKPLDDFYHPHNSLF
jgi:hypothetical protein